jgi:hypothetical protein
MNSQSAYPIQMPQRVRKDVRRKFSQLVANHILGDGYVLIVLAIMDLELHAHEDGEYRRRPRLRLDRGYSLARFRLLYRQTDVVQSMGQPVLVQQLTGQYSGL